MYNEAKTNKNPTKWQYRRIMLERSAVKYKIRQTMEIIVNYKRSTALELSAINYKVWAVCVCVCVCVGGGGGLNRFYTRTALVLCSVAIHIHKRYSKHLKQLCLPNF